MQKAHINYIVTSAFIAATYAALTFFGNIFGISYGPIQIRFSEALTVLPVFTPAAIMGLTIGCFISNIASFNILDMIFGTLATLIAALLTYSLRKVTIKKLPVLSMLMPVIINALVIGLEIYFFFLPKGSSGWALLSSFLTVGIGELIVCIGLGIPFFLLCKKYKFFKRG